MTPPARPLIRRRPSWLSVIVTSTAIFLAVLALLWVRVSAGEDPILGAQATASVTSTSTTTQSADESSTTTTEDSSTSSDDDSTDSSSSDVPTTSAS